MSDHMPALKNLAQSLKRVGNALPGGEPLTVPDLLKHMLESYFPMRIMLIFVGVLLPIVLYVGGSYLGIDLQASMSDYYRPKLGDPELVRQAGLLRDIFVGGLFAIGVLLLAYRGYGKGENILLDVAGVAAFAVALFPTHPGSGLITIHSFAALTFFVCIAAVIFFCKSNTLDKSGLSPDQIAHFNNFYHSAGTLMVVVPVLSLIGYWTGLLNQGIFWAEATGAWIFAFFWWVKTDELKKSRLEERLVKQQTTDRDGSSVAGSPQPKASLSGV